MLHQPRRHANHDEQGFTLIELLVVILIVGVLAAIAIPSFLNQKGKASDADAKAVVRTAQTAQATFFTDNQTYAAAPGQLVAIEPTLASADQSSATDVPHGLRVSAASPTGFDVSVVSGAATPVTFHIIDTAGAVTHSCAPAGTTGCNASGSW